MNGYPECLGIYTAKTLVWKSLKSKRAARELHDVQVQRAPVWLSRVLQHFQWKICLNFLYFNIFLIIFFSPVGKRVTWAVSWGAWSKASPRKLQGSTFHFITHSSIEKRNMTNKHPPCRKGVSIVYSIANTILSKFCVF